MSKGSNSVICNDVSQTIKREPSACKISGQPPACEAGRPSVSESSQDAAIGVSNYQSSRPANSVVTNTYHHVSDKCLDSRTMTVNSNYHCNVVSNGRPVTSAVEYHQQGNSSGRTDTNAASTSVPGNPMYHQSTSYPHNNNSSETSGGGNGETNISTTGATNLPSNYQESVGVGGGSGISSSYHLHHGGGMVSSNGNTMGQVNAPPGYYYTPILNSQQTLLRPIMAAQPPLYSPLLTPQQHTYPMPHASPSAGELGLSFFFFSVMLLFTK